MSYRDDTDAAQARADALQHDLDVAQEELAATQLKLLQSEHDRTDLAEKIAHTPLPSPAPMPLEPEAPVPHRRTAPQMSFGGFLLWLAALVILMWLRAQLSSHR